MGLAVRRFLSVLGALCVVPNVRAQFLKPHGGEDWTVGSTVNVAWNGWDLGSRPPAKCDLWAQTENGVGGWIVARILVNVNLDGPGSFDWKINFTNVQVPRALTLSFVKHVDYDPALYPSGSPAMESGTFSIVPEGASSSSSKSTPTSAPTPSFPISSGPATVTVTLFSSPASTDASAVSDSATLAPKEKKSSKAAIAGGVVGGLVVIALFLGGVLFFLRRLKQKKKAAGTYGNGQQMDEKVGTTTYADDMAAPPAELPELVLPRDGAARL